MLSNWMSMSVGPFQAVLVSCSVLGCPHRASAQLPSALSLLWLIFVSRFPPSLNAPLLSSPNNTTGPAELGRGFHRRAHARIRPAHGNGTDWLAVVVSLTEPEHELLLPVPAFLSSVLAFLRSSLSSACSCVSASRVPVPQASFTAPNLTRILYDAQDPSAAASASGASSPSTDRFDAWLKADQEKVQRVVEMNISSHWTAYNK